jgi:serine phosphatase RsbU (regulator of sigma subunit)/putative methionine-R-sulfoxide reductase with GAF domain
MKKQISNPQNFSLSPQSILNIGKILSELATYEEQKSLLKDFLYNNFGENVFIFLHHPPKPYKTSLSQDEYPIDVQDLRDDQQYHNDHYKVIEIEDKFWLVIPLIHGMEDIGGIITACDNYPSGATISSMIDLGKIAGMAFDASLQAKLRRWQQKQLALVRSVSAQVSQITDVETLTSEITKLVQQTFNYYYVAVFLIDEKTKRLHFESSASLVKCERPEFEQETHPGFALGEHIIGYVAETGSELVASDVRKEPRYKEVDSLAGTKSEVALPLKVDKLVFGVFDVQSDQLQAFDENDLLVLRALADNIAIAIENTRLFQTVQMRADQLTTVSEVSRAITSILDLDQLLQKIVNLIHKRFDFPFVHLFTIDPVQKKITFKAGSGERASVYENSSYSFDMDAKRGIIPWVVQYGETKRVDNVEDEALFEKPPFSDHTSGSEMTIPLFFGEEILGVLDVQSQQKSAFSQEDQQLLETLGDNIAITIRNARLYRSEKWRRQVAESLRDVAGLLSDNTALDDVLQAILQQLHKNLPCDVACIWLFDQETTAEVPIENQDLHLAAQLTSQGYVADVIETMTFTPDDWVKAALTREQPTIRKPNESIGPIAHKFNMNSDYSAIAAPLHTGEEILGMLTLTHHETGRFGQESENITSAFASYVAIAIKNARLFSQSQEQAWISTVLLQVAQATQSQSNIEGLAETIVRLTPMVVGVEGCALLLTNQNSESFTLQAMNGIVTSGEEISLDLPLLLRDSPALDDLSMILEPLIVENPNEDLHLPENFPPLQQVNTMILFPIIARGELLGALLMTTDSESPPDKTVTDIFGEERMNIVQGIIQQTAIGIENLRLLETRQEEAYISTVLLQVAQAVVSNANLADTLESIVNIMPILVGIESNAIYFWDNTSESFQASYATIQGSTKEHPLIGTTYEAGDFPMLDAVFRNNRPVVFPFTETVLPAEDWDLILPDEGQIDPLPFLQSRYPLLMGFPLSVNDEVYGVLLAQDENIATNRERRFELLWGIAQQASLAIQNDRLNKEMLDRHRLEREFQLARDIQQTFLPNQMPKMPGWDMAVHWETARQVGGDFYDYFLLPDGRLAFVIADVSDKGLAASLYMTVTRTLLRAASRESTSPAETLEHVNELLLVNSQNGLFVTTFYGILNLQDGLLTYSIAGHNPPILIRNHANDVVELDKGGIALGAMEDIQLEDDTIFLERGDCLLLYTDGVTEAFNLQDQMYGSQRLIKILNTVIGKPAFEVIQTLEADLDIFLGEAPLSDDTTILAICRDKSLTNEDRDIRSS